MIVAIGLVDDRRSVVLERVVEFGHWLVDPLLRFNMIDRSLALGAQAFGAVIPLLIVLESVQARNESFAADMIERFDLEGDAADVVQEAFAATEAETTVTVFSVFVLVVSVLSFTRRLQRLYEETWEFEPRGLRGTGSGLLWLAFFSAYITLHPALDQLLARPGGLILSLAGAFMVGLLTPYLLLGRRLHWRRLLLQAALTAAGIGGLGIWSAIYMPRAIETSAAAYGSIGVAFAMLTWLWGLGMVLVAAAVYGSPQMHWRRR
jgi:membrane protein